MAFLLQSAYGTKNFQSHSYDQSSLDSLNGVPLESSTDTFKSKMVGKMVGHFSIENHHLPGAILYHFCIFNRKKIREPISVAFMLQIRYRELLPRCTPAKFIITDTKFLMFDTEFLVLNNRKVILCTHIALLTPPHSCT